jgi:hypothetical protein
MFLLGFAVMAAAASRKEFWMVVAVGIEQHLDRYSKKPSRFPRVRTTLHQPGRGRVP